MSSPCFMKYLDTFIPLCKENEFWMPFIGLVFFCFNAKS